MSDILIQRHGFVLLATLNRPEIHNAMSHQSMIEALVSLCEEVDQDDEIRALVLTGAGKSFCAGGNIKDMLSRSSMFGGTEKEIEAAYHNGIQKIPLALWGLKKPVIAAVNGAAVGAGCDMAMMCDIRIGSTNARFAESFVKLGIIPGDGGAWFLPRVVGAARARQMSLTGEMVQAEKAVEWGILSEITQPEALIERALEIAERIAANPPLAVQETKRLLRQSESLTLDEMLNTCAATQARLHGTEDHIEALKAFTEKRKGCYSGR